MAHWIDVDIETDASGDHVIVTPIVNGRVSTVMFADTDLAAGLDITIATTDTEQTVLALTNQAGSITVNPLQQARDTGGTALTYDGTEPVSVPIYAANETITVTVAQGGDTKTGNIKIVIV